MSNLKLKQLISISQVQGQNGEFLNMKTVNQLLEDIPSTVESKFDTPGPGTYDIKG